MTPLPRKLTTLAILASHEFARLEAISLLAPYINDNLLTLQEISSDQYQETLQAFLQWHKRTSRQGKRPQLHYSGENAFRAFYTARKMGLPVLSIDCGFLLPQANSQYFLNDALWEKKDKVSLNFLELCNYISQFFGLEGQDLSFVCHLALAWPNGSLETSETKQIVNFVPAFKNEIIRRSAEDFPSKIITINGQETFVSSRDLISPALPYNDPSFMEKMREDPVWNALGYEAWLRSKGQKLTFAEMPGDEREAHSYLSTPLHQLFNPSYGKIVRRFFDEFKVWCKYPRLNPLAI